MSVDLPSPLQVPPSAILQLTGADVLTSPNNLYYATLLDNGEFVVSQGTDPTTSGVHPVSSTPAAPAAPPNSVGPRFNFINFGSGTGSLFIGDLIGDQKYFQFGNAVTPTLPNTVSLADNGAFTITADTNQTFSNNVNDPVVSSSLTRIAYGLPTITSSTPVASALFDADNQTNTSESFPGSLTLNYTHMSNWSYSLSQAITLGVKGTESVAVPGIGSASLEVSFSETTTLSNTMGGSDSVSKSFTSGVNLTVPAHSEYQAVLTATMETYQIPFTIAGDATYQDGAVVPIGVHGIFTGMDTGLFKISVTCLTNTDPHGCDSDDFVTSPATPNFSAVVIPQAGVHVLPVPEPSTWAMMLLGFGGLGFLGYRQTRRAKSLGA